VTRKLIGLQMELLLQQVLSVVNIGFLMSGITFNAIFAVY